MRRVSVRGCARPPEAGGVLASSLAHLLVLVPVLVLVVLVRLLA